MDVFKLYLQSKDYEIDAVVAAQNESIAWLILGAQASSWGIEWDNICVQQDNGWIDLEINIMPDVEYKGVMPMILSAVLR